MHTTINRKDKTLNKTKSIKMNSPAQDMTTDKVNLTLPLTNLNGHMVAPVQQGSESIIGSHFIWL